MTSPFVKNKPALQLLSSASFSWALQRGAQGKAWVCLAQPPPMPGDNRQPLEGNSGRLADGLHKLG